MHRADPCCVPAPRDPHHMTIQVPRRCDLVGETRCLETGVVGRTHVLLGTRFEQRLQAGNDVRVCGGDVGAFGGIAQQVVHTRVRAVAHGAQSCTTSPCQAIQRHPPMSRHSATPARNAGRLTDTLTCTQATQPLPSNFDCQLNAHGRAKQRAGCRTTHRVRAQ